MDYAGIDILILNFIFFVGFCSPPCGNDFNVCTRPRSAPQIRHRSKSVIQTVVPGALSGFSPSQVNTDRSVQHLAPH